MSTPAIIQDAKTEQTAKVTRFGQLVVAPLDYSTPIERELDVEDVAFNFVEPQAGHSIIITDVILSGGFTVSPTSPADVELYEADAIDSIIPSPGLLRPQLIKGQNFIVTGLNMIVPEGKWVNMKTTDATITATVLFYRAPVERV